ncbi:hypothetical protein AGDE_16082 [Angomonas deanei]|uniref:Uncharacterized protein n=1 Tax=Angomonas deanei TaxID=59799 RepID=A0A7G2C666_9TRYP|nr:hypothetical protein AGDE_16082 [Angomonas deanei]CAD2215206.1 hypothetical protein, conserved [Angomonas deanei]|eukprot:EPY17754.1 hypothetical protein AGDE_16082 [Angomonas deanei]
MNKIIEFLQEEIFGSHKTEKYNSFLLNTKDIKFWLNKVNLFLIDEKIKSNNEEKKDTLLNSNHHHTIQYAYNPSTADVLFSRVGHCFRRNLFQYSPKYQREFLEQNIHYQADIVQELSELPDGREYYYTHFDEKINNNPKTKRKKMEKKATPTPKVEENTNTLFSLLDGKKKDNNQNNNNEEKSTEQFSPSLSSLKYEIDNYYDCDNNKNFHSLSPIHHLILPFGDAFRYYFSYPYIQNNNYNSVEKRFQEEVNQEHGNVILPPPPTAATMIGVYPPGIHPSTLHNNNNSELSFFNIPSAESEMHFEYTFMNNNDHNRKKIKKEWIKRYWKRNLKMSEALKLMLHSNNNNASFEDHAGYTGLLSAMPEVVVSTNHHNEGSNNNKKRKRNV